MGRYAKASRNRHPLTPLQAGRIMFPHDDCWNSHPRSTHVADELLRTLLAEGWVTTDCRRFPHYTPQPQTSWGTIRDIAGMHLAAAKAVTAIDRDEPTFAKVISGKKMTGTTGFLGFPQKHWKP